MYLAHSSVAVHFFNKSRHYFSIMILFITNTLLVMPTILSDVNINMHNYQHKFMNQKLLTSVRQSVFLFSSWEGCSFLRFTELESCEYSQNKRSHATRRVRHLSYIITHNHTELLFHASYTTFHFYT